MLRRRLRARRRAVGSRDLAEHLPTGDGMATALAVLRVMAESGRELADLAGELRTFPQTLVNVRVREKTPVADVPEIQRRDRRASKRRSTAAAACSCAIRAPSRCCAS